ncbi:MAG: pyridoxamine 5'-phosphate oxidase [Myxococcales bacterium]|jgi:pyridoxamine 5'-phosphate oxidase|nr:pyridoxamine 5'-phosphate oxidase [Myxococcales bacterium]
MTEKRQDPIALYLEEYAAAHHGASFEPSRAAFATATRSGAPSVRFVLVKIVDERGFRIFTNYESRKARELDENPHASLAFHWEQTGTQVRIDGVCERLSAEESDAYFASRPRGSQLGAWASPQSQPIDDRAVLTRRLAEIEARFEGRPVERPPFWGGYLLVPSRIEFWKDRESRLHERRLFERVSGGWRESMLAP